MKAQSPKDSVIPPPKSLQEQKNPIVRKAPTGPSVCVVPPFFRKVLRPPNFKALTQSLIKVPGRIESKIHVSFPQSELPLRTAGRT